MNDSAQKCETTLAARARATCRGARPPLAASLLLAASLGIVAFSLTGCAKGTYRGPIMDPPAEKVVVLEVEGPYGEEFTDLLATALAGECGKDCVILRATEVPGLKNLDRSYNVASIVRDLGAQAYVTGRITRSEQVHSNDYYVMGNFQINDPVREGTVGGMDDARCVGRRDFGAGKDGPLEPSDAQKVHVELARYVACRLARGLGH